MIITSTSNPNIQYLQKLLRKNKVRQEEGVFVAEGVRLLEEAVAWGKKPAALYFAETISSRAQKLLDELLPLADNSYQVADSLIDKISATETSQGVIGLFPMSAALPKEMRFLMVADLVRDPGNLGTLMRSARAMGVDGIITTPGTVDAYSPKVIRAGMGCHFALPIVEMSWDGINQRYPRGSMSFWTTVVEGGVSILTMEPKYPIAIVIGGEADGVSSDALARSDANVTIPMAGKTESLNAGVAGSIALYEVMRKSLSL